MIRLVSFFIKNKSIVRGGANHKYMTL